MKDKFFTKATFSLILMGVTSIVNAATIWSGSNLIFTKADGADWTLTANQDFLTSNVIITRGDSQQLFNIAVEASADGHGGNSPVDTEWAVGDIADWATLSYTTFNNYGSGDIGGAGLSNLLSPSVVHLISDDIYIPIQFNSWSSGGAGGFSYTRGTAPASTVPTPAAFWLIGSGLISLIGVRKKSAKSIGKYA